MSERFPNPVSEMTITVADIRVMGRATQGVRLINLGKRNDVIASVCAVEACQNH